jgi:hypothetical protein
MAPLLGDVLDDPHRPLLGIRRVERSCDHAGDERGAVLALQLPFEVELPALRDERTGDLAQPGVALGAGINDFPGLPDELAGAVAEHLGEARVAQEEAPLAREGDAERKVGKERVVFELGVAGAAGIARRRRLDRTLHAAQRGRFGHWLG